MYLLTYMCVFVHTTCRWRLLLRFLARRWVCIYVCMCTYVYIHVYTDLYMCVCTYNLSLTPAATLSCPTMGVYICIYVYVCVYICTYWFMCVCVYTQIVADARCYAFLPDDGCLYMYVCVCVCSYMYIYWLIYVCVCVHKTCCWRPLLRFLARWWVRIYVCLRTCV